MITKLPQRRNLDQHGFVPLLITLAAIIVGIIVLAFLRVVRVQQG